jgi:hypothetical protein
VWMIETSPFGASSGREDLASASDSPRAGWSDIYRETSVSRDTMPPPEGSPARAVVSPP